MRTVSLILLLLAFALEPEPEPEPTDPRIDYQRVGGRRLAQRPLAQDLVDRFVAAGAVRVFVGPNLSLTGPPGVVVPLVNHDNHLHARFAF